MSREHVAALLAHLDTAPSSVTVLDGDEFRAVLPAAPYVTVYALLPDASRPSMSGAFAHSRAEVTIHHVGETSDQVRWLDEVVSGLLLGWTPTLSGRVVWPCRSEPGASTPPRLDTDIPERPAFFAARVYVLESRAAG